MGVHVYESTDLCNLLMMSVALLLLYKKNWPLLATILFISITNRETPAFLLIPVFILWRKEKFPITYLLLCAVAVALPYFLLRYLIHPPQPAWFLTTFLNENIPFYEPGKLSVVFHGYLKFFLFIGPAVLLSLIGFKNKNEFLKVILWIVPFFIPVHFIVGHVEEYRMWMPLFLFLIPAGLLTLDTREINDAQFR